MLPVATGTESRLPIAPFVPDSIPENNPDYSNYWGPPNMSKVNVRRCVDAASCSCVHIGFFPGPLYIVVVAFLPDFTCCRGKGRGPGL